MKRLHELTQEQLDAWRAERARVGREKYGDAHMERYGLVDVMEELLDALNIVALARDRYVDSRPGVQRNVTHNLDLAEAVICIDEAIHLIVEADKSWPADVCTDEQGGHRIWWSDHTRGDDE